MHPYENLDARQKRARARVTRNLLWLMLAGGAVFIGALAIHNARADDAPAAKPKIYIVAAKIVPPGCVVDTTEGPCQPLYTRYQHEPFNDKSSCEEFIAHDPHFFTSLPELRATVARQMPGATVTPLCYEADAPNPDSI